MLPSPDGGSTTAPDPSRTETRQSSLLVSKSPLTWPGLLLVVPETIAVSNALMFTQRSVVPLNERSVSRPPCAVVSSVKVMTVPARTSAQKADWPRVTLPNWASATSSQSRRQPRMSTWSVTTTNSIQSPPLPTTRPKNASLENAPVASPVAVPPPR